MQAASTGAMTSDASPVAIFQRVAARVSWISGWGERFSKGRTSWAGRRRTDSAGRAPVRSHPARRTASVEGVGGLVVGDDDDAGSLRGADEEGKVEGAGGEGESRDTTTPTGKRQVPSCLFEGGRILQVRQQLADKGEDHAGSSLAAVGGRAAVPK